MAVEFNWIAGSSICGTSANIYTLNYRETRPLSLRSIKDQEKSFPPSRCDKRKRKPRGGGKERVKEREREGRGTERQREYRNFLTFTLIYASLNRRFDISRLRETPWRGGSTYARNVSGSPRFRDLYVLFADAVRASPLTYLESQNRITSISSAASGPSMSLSSSSALFLERESLHPHILAPLYLVVESLCLP